MTGRNWAIRMIRRIFATGAKISLALLMVLGGWGSAPGREAQEPEKAPAAVTNDLLREVPFDRITLIDGTVLLVEPISPRPLPVYDPVKQREERRRAREADSVIPEEGNIIPGKKTILGGRKGKGKDKDKETDDPTVEKVKIHLMQAAAGEERDFEVKRSSIQKVEYFEDMLLLECDRLVLAHDYSRAFECCLRIQTRNPGWKGLADRVNQVLYSEGSRALIDGDGERGLRLLRELLGQRATTPGCSNYWAKPMASGSSGARPGALRQGPPHFARARGNGAREPGRQGQARPIHAQGG